MAHLYIYFRLKFYQKQQPPLNTILSLTHTISLIVHRAKDEFRTD